MKCPHCGQEHPDTTKFCPETGMPMPTLTWVCDKPNCDFRKPLPMSAKFCPNCGQPHCPNAQQESIFQPFSSDIIYDEIDEFHEGLARVRRDWKDGFINENGLEIIPCVYDGIYGYFENGLCIVEQDKSEDTFGVIDKDNNIVIPCIYENIDYDSDNDAFYVYEKDGTCGIISSSGEIIIRSVWDYISWYTNGIALAKKGEYRVLIDKNGEIIEEIPSQYEDAKEVSDQLIAVKKNNKWGLIDRQGKVLIDFLYDEIRAANPHIIVRKNGMKGLYSVDCKQLLPCRYHHIFPSENTALVYENKKYAQIIDIYEKKPLCSYYPTWWFPDDEYFPVANDSGIALLLNWEGEVVIPPTQFKHMQRPTNGLVVVTYHDEEEASYFEDDEDFDSDNYDFCGIVNLDGKIIIPWMYESLSIGDNNLIIAKFQGKYCIINQNNEMIFPNGIDIDEWESEKSLHDYLLED